MLIIKFFTNNNFLLASLKSHELYFNNIGNFNDPFEGIFRFKIWNDIEKIKEFYLKHFNGDPKGLNHYLKNPNELEKKINEIFEFRAVNNAVSCFSQIENHDNVLMWAHYANNQAGLCLVFESDEISFNAGELIFNEQVKERTLISPPTGPHDVNYTNQYIDTDPLSRALNQKNFLTTKFIDWQYEKEIRYIAPKSGLYYFNPQSLKKVIFGLRTPQNYKIAIKNIIENLYKDVSFERVILKEGGFKLLVEREDFKL